MKYVTLVVMCFFSLSLCAQTADTNRVDSKGRKHGLWKKYDKGTLEYAGHFINGIPQGEFIYYNPNGTVKSIANFYNGTEKMKTTLFHPNGQKAAEGLYLSQQKDGTWSYYSNSGILIATENYKKGVRNGEFKTYSAKTGLLIEECTYIDNLLHGEVRSYYDKDNVCAIIPYISGKRNGKTISYHYGNIIASQGVYHNNLKEGEWEYCDETGKLRKVINYKGSQEIKKVMVFYIGSQQQRLNQNVIAYFQKTGDDKVEITLTSGKKIKITDDFLTINIMADMIDFCKVTPSIIASNNAIAGYEKVDEEGIVIKLRPDAGFEIYAEGDEAKMVKMLFNNELPKQ
ncbi:MAG: toxin-antitoxin system YwqK family antitoxin [Bacteroidales bacterium]|nr:toxin-antitoxin system YwqK family antitoxin [Bacteroidales bacterium]